MPEALVYEKDFVCPCCGSAISMLLELGHGGQHYVEDCEICCNPIDINYQVEDLALADFSASPAQT